MRLYHDSRAPNPRRVRMFLAEKGLTSAVELVEVSINARAHQTPEHLARHPLGLVPVLELDDGRHLTESVAICRYIDELHPEPQLFGTDAWSRAKVEEWNRHAELELLIPVAQVFRNSHAFWQGRIRQAPDFADIMRELLADRLTWLDRELADRRFLAGDAFSIADITALCALDFGKVSNIRLGDATPNVKRWHAEVAGRPSAKA
ncbi:MAG TPA: glutathione S-transferase family protein [Kofleriaceae bacterium]|jgi:glutathione S-transferase|nr:glutathione S-transferase family protein [Kofleriaceae bacterium]